MRCTIAIMELSKPHPMNLAKTELLKFCYSLTQWSWKQLKLFNNNSVINELMWQRDWNYVYLLILNISKLTIFFICTLICRSFCSEMRKKNIAHPRLLIWFDQSSHSSHFETNRMIYSFTRIFVLCLTQFKRIILRFTRLKLYPGKQFFFSNFTFIRSVGCSIRNCVLCFRIESMPRVVFAELHRHAKLMFFFRLGIFSIRVICMIWNCHRTKLYFSRILVLSNNKNCMLSMFESLVSFIWLKSSNKIRKINSFLELCVLIWIIQKLLRL